MKSWLVFPLILTAGCATKNNARYCDATNACPGGQTCDLVAHECQGNDMGIPDLAGADLYGIDLNSQDLVVPACTTSPTCPDSVPICDTGNQMCRACNGAGDNAACVMHSATTPVCKLSGTNMGKC